MDINYVSTLTLTTHSSKDKQIITFSVYVLMNQLLPIQQQSVLYKYQPNYKRFIVIKCLNQSYNITCTAVLAEVSSMVNQFLQVSQTIHNCKKCKCINVFIPKHEFSDQYNINTYYNSNIFSKCHKLLIVINWYIYKQIKTNIINHLFVCFCFIRVFGIYIYLKMIKFQIKHKKL